MRDIFIAQLIMAGILIVGLVGGFLLGYLAGRAPGRLTIQHRSTIDGKTIFDVWKKNRAIIRGSKGDAA
jgi:hypothetical protein